MEAERTTGEDPKYPRILGISDIECRWVGMEAERTTGEDPKYPGIFGISDIECRWVDMGGRKDKLERISSILGWCMVENFEAPPTGIGVHNHRS